MRRIVVAAMLVAASLVYAQQQPKPAASADAHARLTAQKDAYWEWVLRESPELATSLGEYKYNNLLGDQSLAHVEKIRRDMEEMLRNIKAVPSAGLSPDDLLDQKLLVHTLEQRLEGIRLKAYEMPIDQMFGQHLRYPNLVSLVPLDSVKHYEDYIERLHALPSRLDQLIEVSRQGAKDGLIQPRFLLEKTAVQCQKIAEAAGESNPFATPVKKIPASFADADKTRLREAILKAVDGEVRPAYAKLQKFIAEEYAPKGRTQPGTWSLPNGDELYRFAVKSRTTTNMSPEEIHQLGLRQVAEIEAQIAELAKRAGYPDAASFSKAIHADPKYKAQSREQILDDFRKYIGQMEPKLPQLFGVLPKAKLIVTSVPEYMEKESSTQYQRGTPDGSRAGQVWVRTYDPTHFDMLEDEATAYHEGVPGHHMQISIAQELQGVHPFRRAIFSGAFAEGWALYAERLGKEVGFYQDPGSDLGRLESELFRAIRLVVDTGVHYKHWTREQMVDFFRKHYPTVPEAEIDRYIAAPGQALSYKIGQLKILDLRQRAQQKLGDKFDVRAFHDEVLGAGGLPLDILEDRVNTWIAQQGQVNSAAK